MGKRGPQPTPTAILAKRGSWRAKTRPEEPEVECCAPPCPAWVRGDAQKHWPAIADMLAAMGVMGHPHVAALGLCVNALGRYIELEGLVAKYGYTTATEAGGEMMHPNVTALHKAWDQVMRACREFGMTPASITGIRVARKPEKAGNAKARFFKPKLAV